MFCWSPWLYLEFLSAAFFPLKRCKTFILWCLCCGEAVLTVLFCRLLIFFCLRIWGMFSFSFHFESSGGYVEMSSFSHTFLRLYFLTASLRYSSYTVQPTHFFFLSFSGHSRGIWKVPRLGAELENSCWPTWQPQQHGIWAAPATYTTAHSNAGSLMPGIEPAISCLLVRFITTEAQGNSQPPHLKHKIQWLLV